MLTAHGEAGDSDSDAYRAILHKAGTDLDDECWTIQKVKKGTVTGYTFKKSRVCNRNVLYL